jgi:hypothetical protein
MLVSRSGLVLFRSAARCQSSPVCADKRSRAALRVPCVGAPLASRLMFAVHAIWTTSAAIACYVCIGAPGSRVALVLVVRRSSRAICHLNRPRAPHAVRERQPIVARRVSSTSSRALGSDVPSRADHQERLWATIDSMNLRCWRMIIKLNRILTGNHAAASQCTRRRSDVLCRDVGRALLLVFFLADPSPPDIAPVPPSPCPSSREPFSVEDLSSSDLGGAVSIWHVGGRRRCCPSTIWRAQPHVVRALDPETFEGIRVRITRQSTGRETVGPSTSFHNVDARKSGGARTAARRVDCPLCSRACAFEDACRKSQNRRVGDTRS